MHTERAVTLDDRQRELVGAAAPLVHERVETLGQAVDMLQFLLVDDTAFGIDPDAAAKVLTADSVAVLAASRGALAAVGEWSTGAIEGALRESLIDGLGLKPRVAFGPVRVAVSGRRVSPPLFESLELLGRDTSLRRLDGALARASA
jgi:glutamyl-tRNA synthetase